MTLPTGRGWGGKIAYNGVSFATPQAATLVYPILAPRANARFGEPLWGFDLVSPSGAIPTPLTGGARWGGGRAKTALTAVDVTTY